MTTMMKSDSQIKADVLNGLKRDHDVDETEVGVQVQNGIETLTGSIGASPKRIAARGAAHRVWGERNAIERAASYAPGAHRVDDQTTVDAYQ
jgi:hypothetical protein